MRRYSAAGTGAMRRTPLAAAWHARLNWAWRAPLLTFLPRTSPPWPRCGIELLPDVWLCCDSKGTWEEEVLAVF